MGKYCRFIGQDAVMVSLENARRVKNFTPDWKIYNSIVIFGGMFISD